MGATAGPPRLLQTDEVVTTCYKWLRAVPPKAFTGPHMDRAYVGAGPRLTAWIPLGDVRCGQEELGALCWVPGSHRDPEITERFKDYDRAGSDGERSGWLASDPAALALPSGCHWESTHFDAGDVAVFGMDLLHTTLPNGQNSFRLSCDTRWQPLDAPPPPPGVITGPWKTAALSHPWCCFAMALLRLLALLRLIPLACSGSCAAQRGAAARAWDSIEPECRDKLEKNRTAAALRCLEGHFWEARGPGQRAGDFFTTLRKLRHDAEMFTYLEQEGKVTAEVKKLFRGVFHSAKKQHEDPDKVFELAFQEDTADRKLWQKANNKAVYWDPAGHELPARTLRAKPAALKGLEDSFVATGRAVSDKFLTDKTLRQLKRFLQASTFYFYPRKGAHLLALLEDGLASPILAQVVDGLRHSGAAWATTNASAAAGAARLEGGQFSTPTPACGRAGAGTWRRGESAAVAGAQLGVARLRRGRPATLQRHGRRGARTRCRAGGEHPLCGEPGGFFGGKIYVLCGLGHLGSQASCRD
ncbi:unnamed protein product [Durusdinium trenchii]|uniref:Bifunctional lysine-specific demethylase and histidyl-hydroxylase n=1 Tax=Durusdinium trenchii TaxID=1381693 RepID=A0ABP0IYN8_9DINO